MLLWQSQFSSWFSLIVYQTKILWYSWESNLESVSLWILQIKSIIKLVILMYYVQFTSGSRAFTYFKLAHNSLRTKFQLRTVSTRENGWYIFVFCKNNYDKICENKIIVIKLQLFTSVYEWLNTILLYTEYVETGLGLDKLLNYCFVIWSCNCFGLLFIMRFITDCHLITIHVAPIKWNWITGFTKLQRKTKVFPPPDWYYNIWKLFSDSSNL